MANYFSRKYDSPVGELWLASDGHSLVGLWMTGQKYFGGAIADSMTEKPNEPVLVAVAAWLDRYFAGEKPSVSELSLAPAGSDFRRQVFEILMEIPYGEVTTYGEIAKRIAKAGGRQTFSAQSVGGAVGHNPISIIIPCHRVIGADGSLTGYAGGTARKIQLLEHEGADMSGLFIPKKGTAL